VVDDLGLPPGYIHKYEPGVKDSIRKKNVKQDYEDAKRTGTVSKLDSIWE